LDKYILSFTAASLLSHENEVIVDFYLQTNDWDIVQAEVVENNLLQKGTISTRKREFAEIKNRLKTLTSSQLHFFKDANSSDIKYLCLLSCFKLYQFLFDFSSEILRNKILLFDYQILNSDYESFYDSKSNSYDNLNTVSETTRYKIKQVMFKIFEQSEIINSVKKKNLQKPYISDDLIKLIVLDNSKYLRAFLYSDNEIETYIKRFG
jgi:hypothetical protein